jgi:hypothetical protein
LLAEQTNGLDRTAGAFEGLEDQADCALHFGVGIKIDHAVGSVNQSHWRAHLEFATSSFV